CFSQCSGRHRDLHSFPTRRSSDLDSGFAVPALYELCEKESVFFIIRLKSNAQLQSLAKEYHPSTAALDVSKTECYFEETIYQAKDRKSTRLNSSHVKSSYAVFCLK